VALDEPRRIVQAVTFDATDPAFQGEMAMTIMITPGDEGAEVTIAYGNVPTGIRPEDNDAGTRDSLHKLEAYLTQTARQ
jgi:hypothetical protein